MRLFRAASLANRCVICTTSIYRAPICERNAVYRNRCDYNASSRRFPEPAKAVPNPNEFLQMSVPILFEPEDDVFVSHFLSSDVVGIDVEFVPSFTSIEGRTNRAATLQVSISITFAGLIRLDEHFVSCQHHHCVSFSTCVSRYRQEGQHSCESSSEPNRCSSSDFP